MKQQEVTKKVKSLKGILLFIFSIGIFQYSYATQYYVCDCAVGADPNCVAGNDANAGTSPSAPWKSFAKALTKINSANGGDEVLFARGGAWDMTLAVIYNPLITKNNRLTIADYIAPWATGYKHKPIIRNLNGSAIWIASPTNGSMLHDEGYTLRNLKLIGDTTKTNSRWGIWLTADVDYVLLDSLDIDQFDIGVFSANSVLGTNTLSIGADTVNSNITLKNTIIQNCSAFGYLGNSDSLLIEGCYFRNNGYNEIIFNHHIYISQGSNGVVRNNELYQCSMVNGASSGVALVVHGKIKNLLIENNYIREDVGANAPWGWGIGAGPGYASSEYNLGLVIRNNKLLNVGNVGIAVAASPGAVIENNLIIKEDPSYFTGILANHLMSGGVPSDPTDSINKNLKIRNNTILINNLMNNGYGIRVMDVGTGHQIVSNIVSMTGTVNTTADYYSYPLPISSYSVINNNLGFGNAKWANGMPLAAWQASVGLDISSINANPLFVSGVGPNFNLNLSSSSPAINTGHATLSSAKDYNNTTRVQPDMGAYEYPVTTDLLPINYNNSNDVLYPMPANNFIKIKGQANDTKLKVEIIDMKGVIVLSKLITNDSDEINTSLLPNGEYIFFVSTTTYFKNYKIIITH